MSLTINYYMQRVEELNKELSEWRELHARHSVMVIPGETDSVDAYRKMYFQMKTALEEIKSELRAKTYVGCAKCNEGRLLSSGDCNNCPYSEP